MKSIKEPQIILFSLQIGVMSEKGGDREGQDRGRCVLLQGLLHDLTGMNPRSVDGALEHLPKFKAQVIAIAFGLFNCVPRRTRRNI